MADGEEMKYNYWQTLQNPWPANALLVPFFSTKRRGTATIAFATWEGLTGTGEAKLQPGDKFNAEIGQQIAIGRALIDLGLKHQNRWMLRSQTEEQIKAQRQYKKNHQSLTNWDKMAKTYENYELFINEELNTSAPRPITKEVRKSSQPQPAENLQPRESRRRLGQTRG